MPMALGAAALAAVLALLFSRPAVPRAVRIAAGLALLVGLTAWTVPGVRGRVAARNAIVHNDGVVRRMWEALPADSALVFWPSDTYCRLLEYQIFRGEEPLLYVMNPSFLGAGTVRTGFVERFGFDPMEGFKFEPIRSGSPDEDRAVRDMLVRLVLHVNARTTVPVVFMDPPAGILRRLPKSHPEPAH